MTENEIHFAREKKEKKKAFNVQIKDDMSPARDFPSKTQHKDYDFLSLKVIPS